MRSRVARIEQPGGRQTDINGLMCFPWSTSHGALQVLGRAMWRRGSAGNENT